MTFLVQILAALAIGLLKALLARRDLMSAGQAVEFEEALKHANAALAWKADSSSDPDRGATLRVRPNAPPLTLQDYGPPPSSNPPSPPVQ